MDTTHTTQHDYRTGGKLLIALGAFLLLAPIFDLGLLTLPLLALAFLVAGIATRTSGWLVPAGILGGISLGAALIEGLINLASDETRGGIFLLAFALGWAGIPLLARLFTSERQDWAIIPATIMALIGAAVLGGEWFAPLLGALPYLWPLLLIGGGLLVLRRGWR